MSAPIRGFSWRKDLHHQITQARNSFRTIATIDLQVLREVAVVGTRQVQWLSVVSPTETELTWCFDGQVGRDQMVLVGGGTPEVQRVWYSHTLRPGTTGGDPPSSACL
jgi:hypothetical protein